MPGTLVFRRTEVFRQCSAGTLGARRLVLTAHTHTNTCIYPYHRGLFGLGVNSIDSGKHAVLGREGRGVWVTHPSLGRLFILFLTTWATSFAEQGTALWLEGGWSTIGVG